MTDSRYVKARARGFTLLELLIVGVIVGVLAMIALPWYSDYVKRGQIQDGTTALSDGRVKLEQYFQDKHSYSGGPCPAPTKYFTYGDCNLAAGTFKIVATGTGPLTGFEYTINQDAVQTSKTTWTGGANNACWITRKGDTC